MPQRTIVVRPQLGGIVTEEAFQRSQPATALDVFNFWPVDNKTGRLVPGTRPKFKQLTSATGTVTLLEGVNGKSSLGPFNSFAAGIGGTLYFWNGSGFTAATGAQATQIDTNRLVSAAPFINQLVITKSGAKPIIFDYPTGVATTVVETVGIAPSDARIVVPWQGTVWLSARDADPHVLYAPRVGILTDWNFGADPTDQFAAFFTDTETAGKLSGPVNALMPQTSDTMIVSTYEGLLAMRGHPRQGGVIELIARGRYVLGQGAWCRIPGDVLLFLTPLGIMSLDPSPNAIPTPLSKVKMPEELIGLTYIYGNPTVTMVYDNRWNQVHLFNRGTFEQGWTFDLGTGSFHRIDAASYPFCVTGFPSFDSEQSSGTLFGRYDGIWHMDKFANEEIAAGFTLNPVMISESTITKGIVDRIRVILGRNSPSTDLSGSLRIAVGIDAQDAVSKALAADFEYAVDLQTLKLNNGIAYPKVSGHAVVFSLTHAGGDVSIEEIHMDISDAGFNRGTRSTQFAADGEETDFTESLSALDVTKWVGYQENTPNVAPGANLTEYTHFLDLSLMSVTWWSHVQADGRDIRVSNGSNVEVPTDLIHFDFAGKTGLLAFKMTQPTTPIPMRVWVGNPDVVPYGPTATNGQYNTYDSNWRAFYSDAATVDRTQYQNTRVLTTGTPTAAVGPIGGAPATNHSGGVRYADTDFIAANSLGANKAWTFIEASLNNVGNHNFTMHMLGLWDGTGTSDYLFLVLDSDADATFKVIAESNVGGVSSSVISADGGNTLVWNHMGATFAGGTNRTAYKNGVSSGTQVSASDPTLVALQIPGLLVSADTKRALAQVHNATRDTNWLAYQSAMLDQATFWGAFAAFVQVNPPVVVSFNSIACPSGVINPVETGTWSGYAAATPDSPSASILNSLHLIDLSALPVDWWNAVASDGHDIRATDKNNRFLPFDLVDFNSATDTGFAVVRQNQYKEGASQIRLWVGNATAITISPCALYGKYGVYDKDVFAFWPGGSGVDRTQWLNDTATLTPDTTGPIANKATTYNGSQSALADDKFPSTVPLTLIAAAKITSGTLFKDGTLVSLTGINSDAAAILKTKASANPARLIMRKPTGGEITAGNTALVTAGSWWLQSGVASGRTQRRVLVNGGGTPESTIEGATVAGLTRATIGGQTLPDGSAFNQFTGTLSLVGVHGVVRTDAWIAYQNAMLSQAAFWNTWAWTAQSSSLPQP